MEIFCHVGSTRTISRFGEHFRDGQYSLVSFLFCCASTNGAFPRAQLFVKVGARPSPSIVPYAVGATFHFPRTVAVSDVIIYRVVRACVCVCVVFRVTQAIPFRDRSSRTRRT